MQIRNLLVNHPVFKDTWCRLNRIDAEELLLKERVGTFLFREDTFAKALQAILRRGLKKWVQCFTLTYLDTETIVRDRTIVMIDHRWMFYDDDPTLSGFKYDSLDELLASMKAVTKFPLKIVRTAA